MKEFAIKIHILRYLDELRRRPLVWDTLTTTLWSTVGKGLGFLIPIFIGAWFGVGTGTDAFFFAYGIILFLSIIFSVAVETIIVPFVAELRAKGEDVGAFVGGVLSISGLLLTAVILIFLPIVKHVLAVITKFSPPELDLVYLIIIETAPLAVMLVWTSILSGAMNAHKAFFFPAFSPAFRAVIIIAIIFLYKEAIGVHAIAIGYVIGEAVRLAILFWIVKKKGLFRLKYNLTLKPEVKGFLKTSAYQLIAMSILSFTPIINRTMASWLGAGNITLLEYADRLYMIPTSLLYHGLIVTVLAHWSERYQREGSERLNRDLSRATKIVGIFCLLLTVLFLLSRRYLVQIAYGYGQFPADRLGEVSGIFACLVLGLTPHFIGQLYVRAFIAKKHTRVLVLAAGCMMLAAVLLNLILLRLMGVTGIALSSSLVTLVPLGVLGYLFHREGRN